MDAEQFIDFGYSWRQQSNKETVLLYTKNIIIKSWKVANSKRKISTQLYNEPDRNSEKIHIVTYLHSNDHLCHMQKLEVSDTLFLGEAC